MLWELWKTKKKRLGCRKKYIEEFVWVMPLFLAARLATYIIFVAFLSTTILHSKKKIVPENSEGKGERVVGSLLLSCVYSPASQDIQISNLF